MCLSTYSLYYDVVTSFCCNDDIIMKSATELHSWMEKTCAELSHKIWRLCVEYHYQLYIELKISFVQFV